MALCLLKEANPAGRDDRRLQLTCCLSFCSCLCLWQADFRGRHASREPRPSFGARFVAPAQVAAHRPKTKSRFDGPLTGSFTSKTLPCHCEKGGAGAWPCAVLCSLTTSELLCCQPRPPVRRPRNCLEPGLDLNGVPPGQLTRDSFVPSPAKKIWDLYCTRNAHSNVGGTGARPRGLQNGSRGIYPEDLNRRFGFPSAPCVHAILQLATCSSPFESGTEVLRCDVTCMQACVFLNHTHPHNDKVPATLSIAESPPTKGRPRSSSRPWSAWAPCFLHGAGHLGPCMAFDVDQQQPPSGAPVLTLIGILTCCALLPKEVCLSK